MNQPPPHATFKKVTVNTFVIDTHVKERIKLWNDFVDRGVTRSSLLVEDDDDGEHSADNKNNKDIITSSRRKELLENDEALVELKKRAADHVLSYNADQVSVGPLRVSLKIDSSRLPSFCASISNNNNNNNNPPIVSLTSKVFELCAFERERRSKVRVSSSTTLPADLIDVPATITRAIECLQYAHLSRLIHGRVCSDAFFVSAFESPWIPTMCLGELPLGPQFFANLGQELGKTVDLVGKSTSSSLPSSSPMQKAAINQPQYATWWKVLAPEILDKEPYTSAADVWGIGVLAVQLCMANASASASSSVDDQQLQWTQLETKKDLADATIVSSVFRGSGIPPPAISFATMCLKSNPAQRPTLAALLNHPWLKTVGGNRDNNNISGSGKENSTSTSNTATMSPSSVPVPAATTTTSTSKSSFKADLDPTKVNELITALERSKQARAVMIAAAAATATARKNKTESGSDDDDDEYDEEEEDDESDDDDEVDELEASSSDEDVDDDDDDDEDDAKESSSSDDDE